MANPPNGNPGPLVARPLVSPETPPCGPVCPGLHVSELLPDGSHGHLLNGWMLWEKI